MKLLAGLGIPVWVCAAVMLSVLVNKVMESSGLSMGEDVLPMHKE